MRFSNILSYGEDNSIDFDKSTVTQLIGKNGHGKSSIATILEECLYNKNSRGIAKSDLVNRFTESNKYHIEVDFNKDDVEYSVIKDVTTTAKVTLLKDGENISGHTATQTYKLIELIIGTDFTTFTKLVNQSMKSSLDFLSATDSVRKKFLVDLIGLEEYSEVEVKVKNRLKEVKTEITASEASSAYIEKTIAQYELTAAKPMREIPNVVDHSDKLTELKVELRELENKRTTLDKDNAEARQHNALVNEYMALVEPPYAETLDTQEVRSEVTQITVELVKLKQEVEEYKDTKTHCHTCSRPFTDVPDFTKEIETLEKVISEKILAKSSANARLRELLDNNLVSDKYKTYKRKLDELIFKVGELPQHKELLNIQTLDSEISELKASIASLASDYEKSNKLFNEATQHNFNIANAIGKVKELKGELDSFVSDDLSKEASELTVLKDTFGTKGLVSYKIESSIKVFEELINNYLVQLSQGQFAITFKVTEAKLEVILYDNGDMINIKSVSSGELNKINMSTLLAFRKLMSAISKVNINLLFIDEVSSVLDGDSRDELTELLLREVQLNSLMVTHEYTHPLTRKLDIVKENKISRIDNEY